MRSVMSNILTENDLPWPELQALRLDGDVWSLGAAMAPIDVASTAELRAASLQSVLGDRMVAELETAAWVWGASLDPPDRPQACVRAEARTSRDPASPASVREVVMDDDDIVVIGGVAVSTPLRTTIELARTVVEWTPKHAAIAADLAGIAGFTLDDAVRTMEFRRNLPNKRRAVERLRSVLQPAPAAISPS